MATSWWQSRAFLIVLAIAATLPLACAAIPPFIDLPGHLGRYAIELDAGRSPDLARYYGFHWRLLANLGVDLAIIPFAKIFGLEAGLRVLMAVTVGATAAGLLLVAREAHGRVPATAMFALPLVYGYFLSFGFLNYCFALALAYLAFALWLRLDREGRPGLRAALFVPIALVIWVAHLEGWAVLCVLCGISAFVQRLRERQGIVRAVLLTARDSVALAAPIVVMALQPRGPRGLTDGWFTFEQAQWFFTIVRDRWIWLDLGIAFLLYALIAAAMLRLFRLRMHPPLALAGGALFVCFIVLPLHLLGTSFAGQRLLAPALSMLLLAIDPTRLERRAQRTIALAGTALFAVAVLAHAISYRLYDRSFSAVLAALGHVMPGSPVLVLNGTSCHRSFSHWYGARLAHLGSMAIARRHAFTNDQFADEGQQLVEIRYTRAAPFLANGSQQVWAEQCGPDGYAQQSVARAPKGAFRYVWVTDVPPALWPRRADLALRWQGPNTALFEFTDGRR